MANRQNVEFLLGETWLIDHQAKQSDGVTTLPITGATVTIQIKDQQGNIVLAAGAATVSITDGPNGLSTIQIDPSMQSAFSIGVYRYTIRIVLSNGVVTFQTRGSFTVDLGI